MRKYITAFFTLLVLLSALAATANAEACPDGYIQIWLPSTLECTEYYDSNGNLLGSLCQWADNFICIYPLPYGEVRTPARDLKSRLILAHGATAPPDPWDGVAVLPDRRRLTV